MSNSMPAFKMTEHRLLKLKKCLLERYLQENPFIKEKTARKNIQKQIHALKTSGQINYAYFSYSKNGFIEDVDLFPTKYIPIEIPMQFRSDSDVPAPAAKPPVTPSKKKKKKIARMINFDEEQLHRLIEEAERRDCSYSHLVRCAVRSYLFRSA